MTLSICVILKKCKGSFILHQHDHMLQSRLPNRCILIYNSLHRGKTPSQLSERGWAIKSDAFQRAVAALTATALFCRQSRSPSCLEPWIPRDKDKAHSCTAQIFSEDWLDWLIILYWLQHFNKSICTKYFFTGSTSSWYVCGRFFLPHSNEASFWPTHVGLFRVARTILLWVQVKGFSVR